jgi:hypothetical protein
MRMLRYEVPVDDQWHTVTFEGEPLYVASRDPYVVEFWALFDTAAEARDHRLRVYGTGHPFQEPCTYRGTAITANGALVWHLFEAWSVHG